MTIVKRKSADLLDQSPTSLHHVTEYESSAPYLTKRVSATDRSNDLEAEEELLIKTHSSNGASDSYQMMLPMDSYSCGKESLHSPRLNHPTYTKRDDSFEMCHDHSIGAFNDDRDNESIFSAEHSRDYLYYGAADFRDGCCANSCPKPFDSSLINGDLRGCGQDCLEAVLGGDGAAPELDLNGQVFQLFAVKVAKNSDLNVFQTSITCKLIVAPLAEPELYEDF